MSMKRSGPVFDEKSVKSLSHQDWSGHITMNAQLMKYYEEVNAKGHRLDAMRKAGMLKDDRDRNPILAQKSSRIDYSKHNYHPPPPLHAPEDKWTYPENDWGLMAKFESQKPVYNAIFEKEARYKEKMAELYEIRNKNQKKIDKEVERLKQKIFREKEAKEKEEQMRMDYALQSERIQPNHDPRDHPHRPPELPLDPMHPHHHHHFHAHSSRRTPQGSDDLDTAMREASRQKRAAADRRNNKKGAENLFENTSIIGMEDIDSKPKPRDLSQLKISSIRELNSTHPEVLDKWRAQRAAEFVSTRKNAVEPPAPRDLQHNRSFRPGGVRPVDNSRVANRNSKKQSTGPGRSAGNSSSNDISQLATADMGTLLNELQRTDQEISKQSLKIKLNTAPQKSFGKTASSPSPAAGKKPVK